MNISIQSPCAKWVARLVMPDRSEHTLLADTKDELKDLIVGKLDDPTDALKTSMLEQALYILDLV